jgi:hypothetical protein
MAVLLFLLAIAGGVLVGDLVLENTAAGSVTVLDRSFGGYSQGQLLAGVAALGFMVGVLALGSVCGNPAVSAAESCAGPNRT